MLRIQLTANKRRSRERDRKEKKEGRKTTTKNRKEAGQTWGARLSSHTFSGCSVGLLFPSPNAGQDNTKRRIVRLRHSAASHLLAFLYSGFLASPLPSLLADSTNGSYLRSNTYMQSQIPSTARRLDVAVAVDFAFNSAREWTVGFMARRRRT